MLIDPAEHAFVIMGEPDGAHTRAYLEHALRGLGATVQASIGPHTTIVVLAPGHPEHMAREVRARALLVLDPPQIEELVERGRLDVPREQVHGHTLDALIGGVRSILADAPSPTTWTRVVDAFDACAPEHEAALADYASGVIGRWKTPPHETLRARAPWYALDPEWSANLPLGELRIAPPHWMLDALRGHDRPRHRLARGLSFCGLGFSAQERFRILSSPNMRNVSHLDLRGEREQQSQAVFFALATSAITRSLRSLVLDTLTPSSRMTFELGTFPRLRSLTLHHDIFRVDHDSLDALLESAWCDELDELVVGAQSQTPTYLRHEPTHALPPTTTRLVVECDARLSGVGGWIERWPGARELALRGSPGQHVARDAHRLLDAPLPETIQTLDLRALIGADTAAHHALRDDLVGRIHEREVGRSLKAIRLGHWYTRDIAERLADAGIEPSR